MSMKRFVLFFLFLLLVVNVSGDWVRPFTDTSQVVLVYGECVYHNETTPLVIGIASANVYYNITNLTLQHSKNVIAVNDTFIIQYGGAYRLSAGITYSGSLNNDYEFEVFVNGEDAEHCASTDEVLRANARTYIGITCIDELEVGDVVNLRVENEDAANDVSIYTLNFNFNKIAGFTNTSDVNVIEPVPIIISGGTSIPEGFMELFKEEIEKTSLPFNVTEIIPAKNRLASVAKGCLLWANHLEKIK